LQVRQQEHQLPLVLLVATGRAEREVRLAVLVATDGVSVVAAASPGQRRRQPGLQPEHLGARPEAEAELGHRRRALQPAAARRRGDHHPVAVDDVDVARVAARGAVALHRGLAGPGRGGDAGADRRQPRRASFRAARPQVVRGSVFDEPAPLGGVLRREQRVERDVDVLRVAVPGLTIREGQLRALDDVCTHSTDR
jgi:hypothetical protein